MTDCKCNIRILIFCLPFLTAPGFSQTQPDSQVEPAAVVHARTTYVASLGTESHLYNGVAFIEHVPKKSDLGIPYFQTSEWNIATVHYDGQSYDHVPLLYDAVHDKVIIRQGEAGLKVQLIDQKLTTFAIPGHRFVRLQGDTVQDQSLTPGFYELVVDGQVRFYAKWRKQHIELVEDREVKSIFADRNRFYLFKSGRFFAVSKKSDVLGVLRDNTTLRKFIRKNRIRFRNNKVQAFAQVVEYYNRPAQ